MRRPGRVLYVSTQCFNEDHGECDETAWDVETGWPCDCDCECHMPTVPQGWPC